jgi:hypothetical protein
LGGSSLGRLREGLDWRRTLVLSDIAANPKTACEESPQANQQSQYGGGGSEGKPFGLRPFGKSAHVLRP